MTSASPALRGHALWLLAATLACAEPSGTPEEVADKSAELVAAVLERVQKDELAREDGWIYAVDVGQLLLAAAELGERELYEELLPLVEMLVVDRPDDPYTRGFVLWRARPGEAPDASGTTEALRVAAGLWRGARAFERPADAELARTLLDGYARHATVDKGVWMIRNYFDFETRAYATNSFLVDYAPDFVAEVARAEDSEELADVAERSYALVNQARTAAGLLDAVIQPELVTLTDENRIVFSPDGVVRISNAATVALHAVRGQPAVARGVLDFATARGAALRLSYRASDGELVRSPRPGVETWAVLLRLAVALDDAPAVESFRPRLFTSVASLLEHEPEPYLYAASEALLALASLRSPVER